MEREATLMEGFLDSVGGAFGVLKALTRVDFLNPDEVIDEEFGGKYFWEWLSDRGRAIINYLKSVKIDGWQDDDLLDCLDYNVFALSKAVATQNADIIYATIADCLSDVEKAAERIVTSYDVTPKTVYGSVFDEVYEVSASPGEDESLPGGVLFCAAAG